MLDVGSNHRVEFLIDPVSRVVAWFTGMCVVSDVFGHGVHKRHLVVVKNN